MLVPFSIFCGEGYFCKKGLFSDCHNVNPNATALCTDAYPTAKKALVAAACIFALAYRRTRRAR